MSTAPDENIQQLRVDKIRFASDRVTMLQFRTEHPDTDRSPRSTDITDPLIDFAERVYYRERALARTICLRLLGLSDRSDLACTYTPETEQVRDLCTAYVEFGVVAGAKAAREAVRAIERQVADQIRRR